MHWIYLSPHFDDVALSCGGLVWEQVRSGDAVSIWTVCAGEPPAGDLSSFAQELHTRWEAGHNATAQRRIEDINSCHRLGASTRYFTIPDCIYRRDLQTGGILYDSEAALTGALHPGDTQAITTLKLELNKFIPAGITLVCPLALGSHVDHQLTRLATEGLDRNCWYYADYPYVLRCQSQIENMEQEGWISQVFSISQEGLAAWQESISAHSSQISTFWAGEQEMRLAINAYLGQANGIRLWRRPAT
jgi:LmbE family N-acetylglucosaminyl deacetylase